MKYLCLLAMLALAACSSEPTATPTQEPTPTPWPSVLESSYRTQADCLRFEELMASFLANDSPACYFESESRSWWSQVSFGSLAECERRRYEVWRFAQSMESFWGMAECRLGPSN